MDRYYASTLPGGRGFPTLHFVYDRAIRPPLAVKVRKTRGAVNKLAKDMNAVAGPWALPQPIGHRAELEQIATGLSTTRAFTENTREWVAA